MAKFRNFTVRILITLVLLATVLILFEMYLRSHATHIVRKDLDKGAGFVETSAEFLIDYSSGKRRLVPNTEVVIRNHFISQEDVPVSVNSSGFRDSEITSKQKNELRIIVLGDSVTIADYLPAKETYVEIAESGLNSHFPKKKIELINTGVGNIGTQEQLEILKERGLATQPDVVLLAFYLNDSRPPWGFSGEIGNRGWLRKRSLLAETLYRVLKEKDFEQEKGEWLKWIPLQETLDWRHSKEDFQSLVQAANFDWGAAWQKESWKGVDGNLQELTALAKEHSFTPLAIILPVSFQVKADFVDRTPQDAFLKLAQAHKIPTLDLLPILRKEQKEQIFYDQCHLNRFGNVIVGNSVEAFLAEQLQQDLLALD